MVQKQNKLLQLFNIGMLFSLCILSSCDKTAIKFGSEGVEGDPNVTLIDTFSAALSTFQLDSFTTSTSGHFIVGSHHDPQLGYIGAKSYFQLSAPYLDLRDCTNCRFDSIELHLKLSSGYMGDTSVPFTINVYQVKESMDASVTPVGRNVNNLLYGNSPIVSKTFSIKPSRMEDITIRLPDDFGNDLFRMFKTNSDTVTDNDRFKTYIKGLCLETSASNNALYYFDKTDADSIIWLHYTVAGATPVSKSACLTINSGDNQFNSFMYDKSGTAIAGFTPKTKQLINSTLTGNIAFMHYNSGLFPKIKFSTLYNIKEMHPFVQVLRAELVIQPVKGTYGMNSVYALPPSIEMRVTDDDNGLAGSALSFSYGTETYTQTGSLYIDNLYGESTAYTYDVTGFVNTVISEGIFSKKALIMYPSSSNALSNDQRLLIGNANSGGSVKLKLYTLGL